MAEDQIYLELELRQSSGKAVKQLRNNGTIPAVVHDHGKASVLVQGPYMTLLQTYRKAGKHHPIQLSAGNKKFTVFIREASFDPKKNQLSHLVFNAVSKKQKVETEVPVLARFAEGNEATPAERNGLIVLKQLDVVEVRAIADKIPNALEYDAEVLIDVGDQVTVAQLIVPEGVEVLTEAEHPLATVYEPSAMEAANNAAGGDAEAEAADEVPSEHESGAEEGTQAEELRPGGKEAKESKSEGHNE